VWGGGRDVNMWCVMWCEVGGVGEGGVQLVPPPGRGTLSFSHSNVSSLEDSSGRPMDGQKWACPET
jgi:hypothetical protein